MIAGVNKAFYILVGLSIIFTIVDGESRECLTKGGKFPIPGSLCTSFYVCENWRVLREESCGPDEHFNPIKEWCDWKDLYPCLEKPRRKECPQSNGRFLKNGTDCEGYFDCCNGEPTEKKCPKGLLFDAKSGKCDYEELVECDGSSKSKECPKPNGRFLKPGTKCKTYFECSKGKAKEKKCPEHQRFSVKSEKCDWKERVTCEERKEGNCRKPYGRFLKPGTECKVYFDCYKGEATEKTCPKNQLFDSKFRKCVKKELVTCKDKGSSSESSSNESSESKESSEESTAVDKITSPSPFPDTISERFISDSTTEEVRSPSPVTDTTTEDVDSPSPVTDATTGDVDSPSPITDTITGDVDSPSPVTDSNTGDVDSPSPVTDSTTEDVDSPSPVTDTITEDVDSPSPVTDTTTEDVDSPSPVTDLTAEDTESPSPTDTTSWEVSYSTEQEISTDSTVGEFTSDLPTIMDQTSSSTQEEILNTDSTEQSSVEPTTRDTTVEDILSSTYFPTEAPEVSTEEEASSSYQTELPSSHATSEATSDDIFTESEQFSSSFETTQPSNTDSITDVTSVKEDTVDTSDAYRSTIDPVLVGFECPETTGYYPHPTNRHKFIGCVHGRAYIMDCPSNLVYNHSQRKCLYDN